LLDSPAVLYKNWVIIWDKVQQPVLEPTSRYTGNRFANCSQDLICKAVLAALEQYSSLPPGEAENFAAKFASSTRKLAA
jgi:hypothetical protein